MKTVIVNFVGDYNNGVCGISLYYNNKNHLFLWNHLENNINIDNVQKILRDVVNSALIFSYDGKFTSYCLKRYFDIDVDDIYDVLTASSMFGSIKNREEFFEVDDRITTILKTRFYKGYGYSIIPANILRDVYEEKTKITIEKVNELSKRMRENGLVDQYSDLYCKIGCAIGKIEAIGFKVDFDYIKGLDRSARSKYDLYFSNMKEITHPIFTYGTSHTGRLVMGNMYGIKFNSLAIPKKIVRDSIIPRNDFFYEIDYGNFEPHVALMLYAPEEVKEVFKGKDIYGTLCEKAGIEERDLMKKLLIKRLYNHDRSISLYYQEKLLENHKNKEIILKVMDKYFGWVFDVAEGVYKELINNEENVLQNKYGRIIKYETFDQEKRNVPFQNLIQSTATDIAYQMLIMTVDMLKECKSNIVNFCHDSILIDASKDDKQKLVEITNSMRNVVGEYEFPVGSMVGKNYGSMRS